MADVIINKYTITPHTHYGSHGHTRMRINHHRWPTFNLHSLSHCLSYFKHESMRLLQLVLQHVMSMSEQWHVVHAAATKPVDFNKLTLLMHQTLFKLLVKSLLLFNEGESWLLAKPVAVIST